MALWQANYSGRSGYDLNLEVTVSSQNIAANTTTLRVRAWARSKSGGGSWAADSFSWSVSGPWGTFSGARNLDFRPDSAGKTLAILDTYTTVAHGANGALTITVRAVHSTTSVFGSADTGNQGLALPTIPKVPTGLAVARVSDTQHTLNWTRNSTYTGVVVQRRTNDGAWQQIAVAAGNAATFTDTTTVANQKYEWRVAGVAGAGQSSWSGTVIAYTTPHAPTGIVATRDGSNIVVTASTVPPYAAAFDIRDGADVVASGVSLPWTHVTPSPSLPHTYTVRAAVGALAGAFSAPSNTVQLISPPAAPGDLVPNGAVRASDEAVRLQWVHNSVDSSPQSAYELRYRTVAGAWTTLNGTTASFRDVPLAVGSWEWQVRTKGAHVDFSPWSATAVAQVVDRPGVAVTVPDGDWAASVLPVTWSWFQAQGRPQSAWQVELLDAGSTVVEQRAGSGATSTFTFAKRLTEGDWTVRVRAATGEVWSAWATETFAVAFIPPAAPLLEAEWDESQGGVPITVAPVDDVVETLRVVLERSVDGETWEPMITVTEVTVLIDRESLSFGLTEYRATAFTAEGASSAMTVVVEARSEALWLSGDTGFGQAVRLPLNPSVTHVASRQRALKQYAGRSSPVIQTGEATSRTIAVAGNTWDSGDTASPDALMDLFQAPTDLFLFRDPDGRRVYGGVGEVSLDRRLAATTDTGWNGFWGYSFKLTEATT